jgi:NADH dehydrogenase
VERRRRVVVVGAGFGGLELVTHLEHVPVDVVLVDANNFHTFQPLLYQVATAGLDTDDIAAPVRGVVNRQSNVDVRLARVTGIEVDDRRLLLDEGPPIEYDRLVLAAGAVTATFGVPGADEFGFGLKSLHDAIRLRHHVLRQFERAAVDPGTIDDGGLNVVIAGGGPTGVELAGGLMELFQKVLSRDFPTLDVRRARVILAEPSERLLATFHPKLSERARRTLAARGVEVVLGQGVASTDGKTVELTDGTRIPCPTLVWTAGVRANPLGEVLAAQLGPDATARGGRIVVDDDLTVPGHPEIAVIGDLAAASDGAGGLLPQVAPVAIQAGRRVAANLAAELEGRPARPFHYRDKGSMATIGRHDAVAQLPGGLRFSGPLGWVAWLVLHLVMLIGFRNRANVLVNWAWNYVTYDRGSRLIVGTEEPPR